VFSLFASVRFDGHQTLHICVRVMLCVGLKKNLPGNLENALEKSDEVTLLRSDSNLRICCLTVMNICLRDTVAMCACVHMCVCACAITGILPKIKMDQP